MTFRKKCGSYTSRSRGNRSGSAHHDGFLLVTLLQSVLCVLMISAAFVISSIAGLTEVKTAFFTLVSQETDAVEVFAAVKQAADSEKVARLKSIIELIFNHAFADANESNVSQASGGMLRVGDRHDIPDSVTLAAPKLSSQMKLPVTGKLTSSFGFRKHPITQQPDWHTGVDWAVPVGTSVGAAWPGRVMEVGESRIYGNYAVIDHGGFKTRYCHCEKILASEGMRLRQGETLALSGNTGVSTGAHLHFELIISGKCADPLKDIAAWKGI